MKQKLFIIILLAVTLFSCEEERGEISFLDGQGTELNLAASDFSYKEIVTDNASFVDTIITLRAETSFRVYVAEDSVKWCGIWDEGGSSSIKEIYSPVGSSGYSNFMIVATENKTFEARECSIIIDSYDKEYTIKITQAANTDITSTITDAKFKAYLLLDRTFNENGDDKISFSEAEKVMDLNLDEIDIESLAGIENFINLRSLTCMNLNKLTTLDVSKNLELMTLTCSNNEKLTALDVSKNLKLTDLTCNSNPELTSIVLGEKMALSILTCQSNEKLTALDVSKNVNLAELDCSANNLTSLTFGDNMSLHTLDCSENKLATLDISNNLILQDIKVGQKFVDTDPNVNILTHLTVPFLSRINQYLLDVLTSNGVIVIKAAERF